VVQPERDARLVDEHGGELPRSREGGVDLLDDQLLGQALGDRGPGQEHFRHPPRPDPADELVFAELLHVARARALSLRRPTPSCEGHPPARRLPRPRGLSNRQSRQSRQKFFLVSEPRKFCFGASGVFGGSKPAFC
jgi:hypothetical protein